MSSTEIPPSHVEHRQSFEAFVLGEAEDWHRSHLTRLYAKWHDWNDRYYGGVLTVPHILLTEPGAPNRLGDCATVSGWGSRSQIRLRPSLLTGTHPLVRPGKEYAEGRARFVEDVLLHEIGHQHAQEVTGEREQGYHGHGPAFRDRCNRIGRDLGLTPVRTSKARGKDSSLPSCAHWPHCVRPADYYLGALAERSKDEDEPEPRQPDLEQARSLARVKLLEAALLYGRGPELDRSNVGRLLAAAEGYTEAMSMTDGTLNSGLTA